MDDNTFIRVMYFISGFMVARAYSKYFGVEKEIIEVPVLKIDPETLVIIADTTQQITFWGSVSLAITAIIIYFFY